jgi:hypothetical protein
MTTSKSISPIPTMYRPRRRRDVRLKAQKGRLHALVNNAAISPTGEDGSRLTSLGTQLVDWNSRSISSRRSPWRVG